MKPATFRWFLIGGGAMCVAAGIAGAAMTFRSDVAPAGAASNDARTGAETSAARHLAAKPSASIRAGSTGPAASIAVHPQADGSMPAPSVSSTPPSDPPPSATASSVSTVSSAAPKSSSSPSVGDALREVDQKLLPMLRSDLGRADLKDAFPSEKYDVEILQDQGHRKPNRVRIDLNRNKKWDERWAIDDDEESTVTREVSPNDNELYTRTYSLKGETWVLKRDASRRSH